MKIQINDKKFLPHLACGFEMEINKGDGTVLTGPNGMGKTSILKRIVTDFRDKVDLSFIAQGAVDYFYDRKLIKMRDILLTSRRTEVDETALQFLWDAMGLTAKEERSLSALSGGELQALKLVFGLSKKSDLYLLDEPLQSLDQERKNILVDYLNSLRQKSVSILVVEHEISLFQTDWKFRPLTMQAGTLQ